MEWVITDRMSVKEFVKKIEDEFLPNDMLVFANIEIDKM